VEDHTEDLEITGKKIWGRGKGQNRMVNSEEGRLELGQGGIALDAELDKNQTSVDMLFIWLC